MDRQSAYRADWRAGRGGVVGGARLRRDSDLRRWQFGGLQSAIYPEIALARQYPNDLIRLSATSLLFTNNAG